jgi:hypothetical protein
MIESRPAHGTKFALNSSMMEEDVTWSQGGLASNCHCLGLTSVPLRSLSFLSYLIRLDLRGYAHPEKGVHGVYEGFVNLARHTIAWWFHGILSTMPFKTSGTDFSISLPRIDWASDISKAVKSGSNATAGVSIMMCLTFILDLKDGFKAREYDTWPLSLRWGY